MAFNVNQQKIKEKVSVSTDTEQVYDLTALEEERIYRRGVVTIHDVIAPQGMKIDSSYILLGNTYVRTLFVMTYPRYLTVGWFAPIMNLNKTLDIGMFFYPIPAPIILKQLRNKVGEIEAQLSYDAEKGAARDPMRQAALRDIEQLRDDLTAGVEQFFQFALYVTLYANEKKELDLLTDEVEGMFSSKLVFTKQVMYQAEAGFNSTVPLANDELFITFNLSSSPCATSFPFTSADLTSNSGVLYGINKHNGSLIIFDRFSLQNGHMVVFATSGAGKSFAIKLEILRLLMLGSEVIVIDPELEYKSVSDAVGGTYINISLSSESKVNPFDLPRPLEGQIDGEDLIRSAVIVVKGLLRLILKQVTPMEDSLLDRALLETYAKKDITPNSDFSQIEPPIMADFIDVLEGMEGTETLVIKLKKFTEGTFAGLFNSPTTVNTTNNLVVFSVRDLEDELRPLAIYSLISYIWNVVRSERKKRVLVVDEAWWIMQHEDSAKFLFALVKRGRKYFLGVTTITQDVNDFLGSPYGQAIVNNSALQLLLKQSPAAIDTIGDTFLLTKSERQLLLEATPGHGIFFAGAKHAAVYVAASLQEEQLVTSDPAQLLAASEARKNVEERESNIVGDEGSIEEIEI